MVNAKGRVPIQVSTEFRNKLAELKLSMMKQGKEISLRELTKIIANTELFDKIEEEILNKKIMGFKFDTR